MPLVIWGPKGILINPYNFKDDMSKQHSHISPISHVHFPYDSMSISHIGPCLCWPPPIIVLFSHHFFPIICLCPIISVFSHTISMCLWPPPPPPPSPKKQPAAGAGGAVHGRVPSHLGRELWSCSRDLAHGVVFFFFSPRGTLEKNQGSPIVFFFDSRFVCICVLFV